MKIIKFYNRKKELELLERVKKPFFCIVYGRRRVGKTTLTLHFLKKKDFIYFFVNPKKTETLLLREYTETLRNKVGIREYTRPKNWDEFFKLIFENYKGFVVFDEFQWFTEINEEIPFILQKYWDIYKSPNVIIIGSVVGVIKKMFVQQGSPLFKRADITIKLQPFNISTVFNILENLGIKSLEEKFRFFLLFGGVPYYYHFIEKYRVRSVEEAINLLVLDENAPLRNEVEEIMIESFKREYKTYLSILFAIAEGKTKLEEIASYSNIKPTSLMPYIYDLMDLLEVIYKQPVGFKKKNVYEIKDFFHRFWLSYIYKYYNLREVEKQVLQEIIKKDLNNFFGKNFEILVRSIVKEYFPTRFEKVIKYLGYTRKKEKRQTFDVDVLALNEKTKKILFAECKWQSKVNAEKVCRELAENSNHVQWHNNKRKECFAIFAKSFSKKINNFKGKKVYCFDLKDLERALKHKPKKT